MLLLGFSASIQPNSAFVNHHFHRLTTANKFSYSNCQAQFSYSIGREVDFENAENSLNTPDNSNLFSLEQLLHSQDNPQPVALRFQQRWTEECDYPLQTMSDHTFEVLKNRQILFVAGFLSDIHPAGGIFYEKNTKELAKQIRINYSYLSLPSYKSAVDNTSEIYRKIMRIYSHNKTPVILFGHSKGGAEVFFTLLKYPELILDGIVDRAILIQAAIGGTPLVNPESPTMRGLFLVFGNGLRSMIPKIADQNVVTALNSFIKNIKYLYADANLGIVEQIIQQVSNKIFYIRSFSNQQLKGIFQITQATSQINLTNLGPNDGIILVEDQKCSCFGTDIGVLQSDHFNLALNQNGETKRLLAFTRAILGEIYEK